MMSSGRTAAVYNNFVAPTSAFAQNADLSFSTEVMDSQIAGRCRAGESHPLPASQAATKILGNAIGANLFLLGAAWQLGLVPLSLPALERAIELNGVDVKMNTRAFRLGRLSITDRDALDSLMREPEVAQPVSGMDDLESVIDDRCQWLTGYQNAAYASRYESLVRKVMEAEQRVAGAPGDLAEAVARYYAKLLAYKDEYEVARLMTRREFFARLDETFEGDYSLKFNLAPPLLSRRDPVTGRYAKIEVGAWILPAFRMLAPLKVLRGPVFDIFGYSKHRRQERQLIVEYEQMIDDLLGRLRPDNLETAARLASLPEHVRGYDVVKDTSVEEARILGRDLMREMQGIKVHQVDPKADQQPEPVQR